MKRVLYWIKSNMLATTLAVVALASIGVLFYVHVRGAALKEQLKQRYETTTRTIRSMARTPVTIPPEHPDGKPMTVSIVPNPPAIEQLERVYQRLDEEYSAIFDYAMQINRGEKDGLFPHLPMLEGLFPNSNSMSKPFEARLAYRDAFKEMLQGHSTSPNYPRLNAGMPPAKAEIDEALARVEQEFLSKIFPIKTMDQLTAQERTELHKQKSARLRELYRSRASQINIYAVTDTASPETPFHIGAWSEYAAAGGRRPEMEDIWEGQMGLWIQQDLVTAIALTNKVGQPGANVINQPVKRLVSIRVVPGYVGLDGPGAIMADAPTAQTGEYRTLQAERAIVEGAATSGDVRLLDDFSKAPTGRRSNTLYDVRHVWLTVDVDYQRLPELFDSLARVNFMTVLKMKLEDVDEYEMWREGFVYGTSDVQRVTMLIETLWLRDWTLELMPDRVKERLGIAKPEQQTTQ